MSSLSRLVKAAVLAVIAVASLAAFARTRFLPFALAAAAAMLWLVNGSPMSGRGSVAGAEAGASLNENLSTLSGDLKVVYSNVLTKVLPDSAIIQKRWPLDSSGNYPLVGDFFSAVVALQLPWGFSFLGNGTEGTTTNYTLGDALAGQTKPAQVYGNTTVLVDNLQYQILDRASTSGGKQAVLSAMTLTGEQMSISARNVLELEILHGRQGLGAASGAISTLTVTFDGATTSAGILSTLIGARVQWMQSNNTSARTANDGSNYLTVSAVDVSTFGSYTLTMVATGTTNVAAITTGDLMYIAGMRGVTIASSATSVTHYEQLGLGLQLSATTGTQFAIDKAAYVGWVANQQATIGALTPSVMTSGAATILGRGGKLGKYVAIVSPKSWGVLNAALATNETYNQQAPSPSMSKKSGTDDIMIYNGGISIEVVPHPFQKDGQYYMFPESELHRIGSTDLTFAVPGRPEGDEFYFPVNGMAAMQRQCRADFQCVMMTPPSAIIGTGITYS